MTFHAMRIYFTAHPLGLPRLRLSCLTARARDANQPILYVAKHDPVAPPTTSRCRTVLRTLLEEAGSEGQIASNPAVRKGHSPIPQGAR
jgi:hypothetical protein